MSLLGRVQAFFGSYKPFAAKINNVGVNPSRNLDIYTNIYAGEGIETTEMNDISSHRNAGLEDLYQ